MKNLRIEYRRTLVSLHKIIKGSFLKYEKNSQGYCADLVLRDKRGFEIARLFTCGTAGNVFLKYCK